MEAVLYTLRRRESSRRLAAAASYGYLYALRALIKKISTDTIQSVGSVFSSLTSISSSETQLLELSRLNESEACYPENCRMAAEITYLHGDLVE